MPSQLRATVLGALSATGLVLAAPHPAAADHVESPRVGYDVSHPQCDRELPGVAGFGIVGVNGGLATRPNPCLAEQLAWAAGAADAGPGRPDVQLYVNTANPGEVIDLVITWPLAGDTPYGTCDGSNSLACSWQYGWIRAYADVHGYFGPAARQAGIDPDPAGYRWWLDVETMNTWQYGSPAAQARNRAALEGMTAFLAEEGAEVGVYSTAQQWSRIVGDVPPGSPLYGLDSWLAGASSAEEAVAGCRLDPLVPGGEVVFTQWVADDLDHNLSCR